MQINGPGKYDNICTLVREGTEARGVIVIILGGNLGNGFSAQFDPELAYSIDIPARLREVADQMEGK